MKTILFHTIEIYVLATGISFLVAFLIKLIERSVRSAPAASPTKLQVPPAGASL